MAEINARGPLAALPAAVRRPGLRRSRSGRLLGGVAAGLGAHLGLDVRLVRIALIGLAFASGFGIVVYLLLWVLTPASVTAAPRTAAPLAGAGPRRLLSIGLLLVGLFSVLWVVSHSFGLEFGWPFALAAIGFAVVWGRGGEDGRGRFDLASVGNPLEAIVRGRVSLPRIAFGSALILGGLGVFLAATTSFAAAANVLLAVVVTTGGLALVAGPWFWRVGTALMEERNSRIRSEARAEMAAHLHDSVLQTLALIQRSQDSREMGSLARTQERELRAWLYGRAPTISGLTLRDAVDEMAGRIERAEHVRVEAIVVGDLDLDESLRALVAAASEATMNAARHAGVEQVAVYVEVEASQVNAFISDEGAGFERTAVPDDRRGIADSIVGRMERYGGSATIRSEPGRGTEVVLRLPRSAA